MAFSAFVDLRKVFTYVDIHSPYIVTVTYILFLPEAGVLILSVVTSVIQVFVCLLVYIGCCLIY